LLTNFTLPRHPIGPEEVRVTLSNAGKPKEATVRRIDGDHANAKRRWQELGAPEYLSADVLAQLNAASALEPEPQAFNCRDGTVEIAAVLAPLSVTAITLEYTGAPVA
jgi:xylan 1,4-beta-xylosidase